MTVFDPSTLRHLVDDADGQPFVLEFVLTYRRMLHQRVARLADAVRDADHDEAMDAALSLKVSSTMIGATEIAALAHVIEGDLRAGDRAATGARVLLLPSAAAQVESAIDRYLDLVQCSEPAGRG